MIKKISSLLAIAAISVAGAASATTLTGNFTVQKGAGPVLNCDAEVDLLSSGQVASVVLTDGPGSFGCFTVTFNPNTPKDTTLAGHNYTGTGNDFRVDYLYADTSITPGDCWGGLDATWNGTSWNVSGTLGQVSGGGNCVVSGQLNP